MTQTGSRPPVHYGSLADILGGLRDVRSLPMRTTTGSRMWPGCALRASTRCRDASQPCFAIGHSLRYALVAAAAQAEFRGLFDRVDGVAAAVRKGDVTPAIKKRTVAPRRRPNADLRTREYLTEAEVKRLLRATRGNRCAHRSAKKSDLDPSFWSPTGRARWRRR
jgi:hypothetical protein